MNPLFVFFGAESEYVLNPLYREMTSRGHRCIEIHATPDHSIATELATVVAEPGSKVLITSAHFMWDDRYMADKMDVPDCPALTEVIAMLQPDLTVYYPHDLSQPTLTVETTILRHIDLFLAPTSAEQMYAGLTNVIEVGWIKAPVEDSPEPEHWGRGLWLTMSLEYVLIENGLEKTLGFMDRWLHDWLWIKFPPFPQFDELERTLKDRGINIIDRNTPPPIAARHFDFVVTNGESSVVRESALMGVPTYIVTGEGLFGERSGRNIWQFRDLENVHIVEKLNQIPKDVTPTLPRMRAFNADKAISTILDSVSKKLAV